MAGTVYLVHGPVTGSVDLSGADGFLVGADSEYAGLDVASAGDANGDGYGDIVVGSPYFGGGNEGQAYVMLGPVVGERPLSSSDAVLHGEYVVDPYSDPYSYSGASVASAGDVNGDSLDDVLVGAYGYDSGAGAAYLLLAPYSGEIELANADARIVGGVADLLGYGVASAGDTDGDGLDDILVGQPGESRAITLLFLGPVIGATTASDADTSFATGEDDYAGLAPEHAGDVNGDGFADILIPAPWDADGGERAGAVYLVHGPGFGDLDLAVADGKLIGSSNEVAGASADGAGDIDGDGFGDVVVGAPVFGSTGGGRTYLVRGPISGVKSLADADLTFEGEGDDRVGYAVAGAGDVNGDSRGDLLIGGPGDDDGGEDAGAAWLVLSSSL